MMKRTDQYLKAFLWAVLSLYIIFPSVLLLIFREPEITATLFDNTQITAATFVIWATTSYLFGIRGLTSATIIALILLRYKMDVSLWKPPPELSLQGKTTIITGGSSGLGKETARALVRMGAHVIITCRSTARCRNAAEYILASQVSGNGGTIDIELLNLSSLQSTYDFTKRVSQKTDQIHYLINNAGSTPRYALTEDLGLEDAFGSMHLAHMGLTLGLLPLLEKAGKKDIPARVVMVSSEAGVTKASLYWLRGDPAFDPSFMTSDGEGDIRGEILRGDSTIFGSFSAYARSKLCNILFAFELNRILQERDIPVIAHSLHTGGVGTKTSSEALKGVFAIVPGAQYIISTLLIPILWRNVEAGSRILLFAALGSNPPNMIEGGQYINGIGRPALDDQSSARMESLRLADAVYSKDYGK